MGRAIDVVHEDLERDIQRASNRQQDRGGCDPMECLLRTVGDDDHLRSVLSFEDGHRRASTSMRPSSSAATPGSRHSSAAPVTGSRQRMGTRWSQGFLAPEVRPEELSRTDRTVGLAVKGQQTVGEVVTRSSTGCLLPQIAALRRAPAISGCMGHAEGKSSTGRSVTSHACWRA